MAERKNIVKGQIGNAIESVAPDHIATVANQIFDERRQEYQDDINENVGYNEDNPEFVKVYVIEETHQLLWGIEKDGNIFYGAGIPRQIKAYIDFVISRILNGDEEAPEIDSLNKIIAFLDGFSTSETLFEILLELDDKKVDKVEGKSLIDEEYAAGVSYKENPDFVNVKLDADGKIIEANYKNGTKLFGAGIKVNKEFDLQGIVTTTIDNPEFSDVKLDINNRIIEATYKDGSKFFGTNVKVNGDIYAEGELKLRSLVTETMDNPEFAAVWTINNKILFGVQHDGNFLFGCGIPRQIEQYIRNVIFGDKDVTTIIDTLNEITTFLDGFVSGSNLLEYLNETYGYYEDNPEWMSVLTDREKKILEGYRNGVKFFGTAVENDAANIHVKHNPEYVEARVDSEGKMYFGARRDGDVIVGGVNINEMKRDLDVDALEVEYDSEDHGIYVTENVDSTIGLEYDSETGDVYQVKDSRVDADMTMDETGNVYIEQ